MRAKENLDDAIPQKNFQNAGENYIIPGFFCLIFIGCMEKLPRDTAAIPNTWNSCEEPKLGFQELGMVD